MALNVEDRDSKIKRKTYSKSPNKNKMPVKNEAPVNKSLKSTKAQLLDIVSIKNNGLRSDKQTNSVKNKAKSKEKQRKKKIGSLVNNLQSQAVSNINLHMNFYQMDDKVLSSKGKTVVPNGIKNPKNGSTNAKKIKSVKDIEKEAPLKKHASKKSISRYSTNNKGKNLKNIKQYEIADARPIKPIKSDKKEAKAKKKDNEQVEYTKWEKINRLMKKLKTKLEKEEPEKIKVFKNIEKILKHVKNKKKNDPKEAQEAKATIIPEDAHNNLHNDKLRLKTLQIEAPKKINKLTTEDNIAEKYKFLEYLEPKNNNSIQKPKKAKNDTEDEHFLTKTFELVKTNNYFFLPKKEDSELRNSAIQNIARSKPYANNNKDAYNLHKKDSCSKEGRIVPNTKESNRPEVKDGHIKGKKKLMDSNSDTSQKNIAGLKIIPKPDMERWATPSKRSIELISNEITLRLSKSQIEENLNKSIRNSSIMLNMAKKRETGRSIRYESIGNFSKDLKENDQKIARSCQDFDPVMTKVDKEDAVLCDSIIKPPNDDVLENGKYTRLVNDSLGKSLNELEMFDKLLKPNEQSLSLMFQNRAHSTETNENTENVKVEAIEELNTEDVVDGCGDQLANLNNMENLSCLAERIVINEFAEDLIQDELFRPYLYILQQKQNNYFENNESNTDVKMKIDSLELLNDVELLDSQLVKNSINQTQKGEHDRLTGQIEADNNFNDAIRIADQKLEDVHEEKSIVDQSNETVYAVRTHFNAINEYMYILCDYLKTNTPWNPKNLVNWDAIDNLNIADLFKQIKSLKCFNRKFYETIINLIKDEKACDELYESVEKDIQTHCGILSNMKELIKLQRIFHRSIFDCFLYNFMKTLLNNILVCNKTSTQTIIRFKQIHAR